MNLLALDIGGTAVKYGCFGKEEVFGLFSVKDENGFENLPEKIMHFISDHSADCVGICAPGPFDFESGTGLMEHKLPSLYQVSLRKMIQDQFPNTELFFIHDATAFVLGTIQNNPTLSKENIAGIMLGTGLGYIHCINGCVEVNSKKTPLHPLWNMPYRDGIAEQYVSATAIINKAKKAGYHFNGVKEIAIEARRGNVQLKEVLLETGVQLGELIDIKRKEDSFDKLVIGGQVSLAWDLMRDGFERLCEIPYEVFKDPTVCSLFGIRYCAENGVETIYMKGESS